MQVPVRTWREKAILASVLCNPLSSLWDGFDGYVGGVHAQLYASSSTDDIIDEYFGRRPQVDAIESLLRSLRGIAPGPDATLEVPPGFPLLEKLDEEIRDLVSTDVDELLKGPYPSRREIAEASIVAIDLREELGGGDA
jgi:hypothetical protein